MTSLRLALKLSKAATMVEQQQQQQQPVVNNVVESSGGTTSAAVPPVKNVSVPPVQPLPPVILEVENVYIGLPSHDWETKLDSTLSVGMADGLKRLHAAVRDMRVWEGAEFKDAVRTQRTSLLKLNSDSPAIKALNSSLGTTIALMERATDIGYKVKNCAYAKLDVLLAIQACIAHVSASESLLYRPEAEIIDATSSISIKLHASLKEPMSKFRPIVYEAMNARTSFYKPATVLLAHEGERWSVGSSEELSKETVALFCGLWEGVCRVYDIPFTFPPSHEGVLDLQEEESNAPAKMEDVDQQHPTTATTTTTTKSETEDVIKSQPPKRKRIDAPPPRKRAPKKTTPVESSPNDQDVDEEPQVSSRKKTLTTHGNNHHPDDLPVIQSTDDNEQEQQHTAVDVVEPSAHNDKLKRKVPVALDAPTTTIDDTKKSTHDEERKLAIKRASEKISSMTMNLIKKDDDLSDAKRSKLLASPPPSRSPPVVAGGGGGASSLDQRVKRLVGLMDEEALEAQHERNAMGHVDLRGEFMALLGNSNAPLPEYLDGEHTAPPFPPRDPRSLQFWGLRPLPDALRKDSRGMQAATHSHGGMAGGVGRHAGVGGSGIRRKRSRSKNPMNRGGPPPQSNKRRS